LETCFGTLFFEPLTAIFMMHRVPRGQFEIKKNVAKFTLT
jgi:hypothetical protein